jgi:hypothetical protein
LIYAHWRVFTSAVLFLRIALFKPPNEEEVQSVDVTGQLPIRIRGIYYSTALDIVYLVCDHQKLTHHYVLKLENLATKKPDTEKGNK